jgi:hypothetical protein
MGNIGFAAATKLAVVGLLGIVICAADLLDLLRLKIRVELLRE